MAANRLEYLGVAASEGERTYRMRLIDLSGKPHDFTLVIDGEAFRSQRVRFQDGPDICYQKMQRELLACEGTGALPSDRLYVTDGEIEDYRVSHAPRPVTRKPRPGPIAAR